MYLHIGGKLPFDTLIYIMNLQLLYERFNSYMNKTVLITGASGDIGSEIARTFISNGYTVVGIYNTNEVAARNLSEELGDNFHFFKFNLADFGNAEILFNILSDKELYPDILINNAGISVVGLLQDMDNKTWDNLWNTNVTSVIAMSRQAIPVFLKHGYGKIINISSVWGNVGAACETGYSATKGAVNSFTKALAKELAPSNIQVNALSCGIIDTKMNGHLSQDDINDIVEEIPASRIGTPKDIAEAALALAQAGSYITGQIISVDGGWQI